MNRNEELYKLNFRTLGHTVLMSIISQRGTLSASSSEKVIPPIIEYNKLGDFRIIGAKEVVQTIPMHPYKANSADFNKERIADVQVSDLMKGLENFPTLPTIIYGGQKINHPIAELIYGSQVYLKPTAELQAELDKLNYLNKSKLIPQILERVAAKFATKSKYRLDLFSVPKRKVGTFGYITSDGYSEPSKVFSFGYHFAVPNDRLGRELSSLKSAERFVNPYPVPWNIPDSIRPFVTMVRVAVVGLENSMLDGADMFPSCLPKIACKLTREEVIKDVSQVPMAQRNLRLTPFRSGIDVQHINYKITDETQVKPGAVRLIFPGGIKVAAQWQDVQARDEWGDPIDLLMDFETFAKKGAVATLAMMADTTYDKNLTLPECIEIFKNMQQEDVWVNGTKYTGWVGYLPVLRPGQRYTELSKGSNDITVDLIAKAILNKSYKVKPRVENQYQELRQFRAALTSELKLLSPGD